MSGRVVGWRAVMAAVSALFVLGGTGEQAQAAEVGDDSIESASGLDQGGDVAFDLGDSVDEAMPMAQRYAPPPPRPRYRHYRPYRPHWGYRVVPPPIFAPGWFGLYFFGNPPPAAPPPTAAAPQPVPPRRDFRHINDYSFGVTVGAYNGVYRDGFEYNDPGLRFSLAYRNAPVLGAEMSVGFFSSNNRFDGQGSDARQDVPIQLSAVLHAFPRSPIQPYFLFGATGNVRTYAYRDSAGELSDHYTELRVGPHVGVGVELLIGDRVSVLVDGRSVLYTMVDRSVADQTFKNDLSLTGGLNFYF